MTTEHIVIFFAEYLHLIVAVIAGFVFLGYRYRHLQKQIVLTAVISAVLALGIDKLLNRVIDSPRPFVVDDVVPLFLHVADNGFPSEHTLLAVVIACLVYIQHKKTGLALLLLAVVIGIARVIAGVHHPIDIVGALLIGVFSVSIARWLVARYVTASPLR